MSKNAAFKREATLQSKKINWMCRKLGIKSTLGYKVIFAKIAEHFSVPLLGGSRRKRREFITNLISGHPDCPFVSSKTVTVAPIKTKPQRRILQDTKAVPPPKDNRPNEEAISKFYASWEWRRLRYDFIKDRDRVCQCCGARPPDVRIVVDHIKPIRFFWSMRLNKDNLQLLCDPCNMGKGSRDQTDWGQINAEEDSSRMIWGDSWDEMGVRH
jgi:hypothetical protein